MEAGEALGGSSHARLSLGLGFGGNRLSCALLLVLVSLVCSLVSEHNTMRDSIFVFILSSWLTVACPAAT